MTCWWMTTMLVGFIIAVLNVLNLACGKWLLGFFGLYSVPKRDVIWSIIWSIFLVVTRFIHGGRVIAGDYCAKGSVCNSE